MLADFHASGMVWETVNDPVMGGKSESTVNTIAGSPDTTNSEGGIGIFAGHVRIVPSLGKPGFCNLQTAPGQDFPDASSFGSAIGGGLAVRIRQHDKDGSSMVRDGFLLQIETGSSRGNYQATISLPPPPATTDDGSWSWSDIHVPWEDFTLTWRGRKIAGPPVQDGLNAIQSVSISVQPASAGKFDLAVDFIQVATAT